MSNGKPGSIYNPGNPGALVFKTGAFGGIRMEGVPTNYLELIVKKAASVATVNAELDDEDRARIQKELDARAVGVEPHPAPQQVAAIEGIPPAAETGPEKIEGKVEEKPAAEEKEETVDVTPAIEPTPADPAAPTHE